MGKYPVSADKEAALSQFMESLEIFEEDLLEKFIRGSGKGGQKINKTSSCVYLLHLPSGTEVKCQRDRSQALNRYFARRELCEKIETQIKGDKSKREQEREKIRRQKQRRSRKQKEKMLDDKHRQSEKKEQRRTPGEE